MSSRHDRHRSVVRQSVADAGALTISVPEPTRREAATMLSLPTLLLVVHFAIQPLLDGWARFGYVRYSAARTVAPEQLAPEPLAAHAWWWHEVTRFSHALIHSPDGFHTHVLGNVALILVAAWVLFVLLTALGQRHRFALVYWELVVVAPLVGSFSFDLFGTTPHGYGASTIGFAFLGVIAAVALFTLATRCLPVDTAGPRGRQSSRFDGGHTVVLVLAGVSLLVALFIIGFDVAEASTAMPVHLAGVGFGYLVGTLLLSSCSRLSRPTAVHRRRSTGPES